jgi:hypothetical protein
MAIRGALSYPQRHELLAVTLEPTGQVEFEQHDMNLPGLDAGGPDQLVNVDRAGPKGGHDQLALALADVGQRLRSPVLVGGGKLDRRIAGLTDSDRLAPKLSASASSASASVQRRMSERPSRRDRSGRAAMAAAAPPNLLTRARKVAGPTFSLRISLSQASRCGRLRRAAGAAGVEGLELRFANARLLASRQPLDIGRVADI